MGFMAKPLGFALGGLGFASTAGAFITGAAKQANQNIEEQQAQDRQDDVLQQAYTARADKGIQEYKSLQNQYNSVLTLAGGNKQITEAAMGLLPKNAKTDEIIKAVNAAGATVKPDSNFQPSYMQNRRSDMDFMVGRLKPKYKNMLQVPDDNNNQSRPGVIAGDPSSTPNNNTSSPFQQPDRLSADDSANATPVAGAQPVSLDTSDTTSPAGVGADNGQPFQTAQNTPNANGFTPIPGADKPMTAAQREANRLHQQSNDLAQKKFELDKERKPSTFDEQEGAKNQSTDITKYLHDPKTGLQARKDGLQALQAQNFDLASMQQLLERGFKSGSTSEFFNNINRFTNGALGLDLQRDLGMDIANYRDVNLLRKDVANAVIEKLKTLHFGRITNYESQLVLKGFMSEDNDPNTNLKIVLAMRALTNEGLNGIQKEYSAVYPEGMLPGKLSEQAKNVAAGRQVVSKLQDDFTKSGDAPWPQIKSMDQAAQIPVGQWFEVPDGTMYMKGTDGKLKRAGDNINAR